MKNNIKFAVVDNNNKKRASIWKFEVVLKPTEEKSEIHITSTDNNDSIYVSVHNSGDCYIECVSGEEVKKWTRKEDRADGGNEEKGFSLISSIEVPNTSVNIDFDSEENIEDLMEIGSPSEGKSIKIGFFIDGLDYCKRSYPGIDGIAFPLNVARLLNNEYIIICYTYSDSLVFKELLDHNQFNFRSPAPIIRPTDKLKMIEFADCTAWTATSFKEVE
jgi:hypothetical protein